MSTNITRYLYSRRPVPHAFPVNKYLRNLQAHTQLNGVLDNKSLITCLVVQVYKWVAANLILGANPVMD